MDTHNKTARTLRQGEGAEASGGWSELLLFARNFLRQPGKIGWFLPTSRIVVGQVLQQVDWGRARVIVEFGPGLGSFTGEILKRMRPDAQLLVFETNAEFCRYLESSIQDPRFHLLPVSATEIDAALQQLGLTTVDYVISGIPFKTLPDKLRRDIVRKTYGVLGADGRFLVYQFSKTVRPYLRRVFGRVQEDFQLLNIMPARLYYCAR